MSQHSRAARVAAVAAAIAFPLTLAACGSSDSAGAAPAAPAASSAASSSAMAPSMSPSASASASMSSDQPFGAGCSAVPTSGKGSFDGMSSDPVATAASNNPVLSTLVTAVKTAGLVDTLNNAEDITVFAPTNDAFKGMDQATLKKALGDKKLLTTVLTGHVVAGRLSPDQVAGEHTTLAKNKITVKGSGESFTVGDAKVICGNVQTANETVYIIDDVLLPSS